MSTNPSPTGSSASYSVCVRDHFMIAHSFRGAVFGPAQRLHGATYIVDLVMHRRQLDADGVVVDIGLAGTVLKQVLNDLNFSNLDDNPAFQGQNTTTEFMARVVFDRIVQHIHRGGLGAAARGLDGLKVTLHESHVAWAAYEAPLPPADLPQMTSLQSTQRSSRSH